MVDAAAVAAEIKRFAPEGAALLLDSRKICKGDVFCRKGRTHRRKSLY